MRARSAKNRRGVGRDEAPFSYEVWATARLTPPLAVAGEAMTANQARAQTRMGDEEVCPMKQLPKRDGYKPKRPRRESDRDIILAAVARGLAEAGAAYGVDLPPAIAKCAKREERA
jgi:hypothetical protein